MKGLLLKDIRHLKEVKMGILIIVIVSIPQIMTYTIPGMLIYYLSLFTCLTSTIGIQYDMYENGAAYLFSMPFTRREYVKEKYLFACGLSFVGWLAAFLLEGGLYLAHHLHNEAGMFWSSAVIALSLSLLVLSIMIPCYLKFPIEKGRMVFAIFIALSMVLAALFVFVMSHDMLDWIFEIDTDRILTILLPALLGVSVLVLVISYVISVRIIEKREF